MKKTLPAILLGIILVNLFGYTLILELDRYLVKRNMAELIESHPDSWTEIKIPLSGHQVDFRRVNAREILFEGKMYDVMSESCDGTSLIFRCIRDIKEERIAHASARNSQKNLFAFLFQHLISQAMPVVSSLPVAINAVAFHFPPVTDHHPSAELSLFNPPPES